VRRRYQFGVELLGSFGFLQREWPGRAGSPSLRLPAQLGRSVI